jgi:hypothetical protein
VGKIFTVCLFGRSLEVEIGFVLRLRRISIFEIGFVFHKKVNDWMGR